MFRVIVPPNSETLYEAQHQGPYDLVNGVRVCDYTFEANLEWVLPDRTKGLSFSKTYSHLKNTRKMLSRHARGYNQPGPANVAWWILSKFDVPEGLEFIKDPKNSNHYFLAAIRRMLIGELVDKLEQIACHMTVALDVFFEE